MRSQDHTAERRAWHEQEYDVVVCGAGSAGSVVAGRLAANSDARILLVEAGGSDDDVLVTDPDLWIANLGTERDWNFVTEPNPHLHGRRFPYPMGRGLGGGASINASVWSRGHRSDWDSYASISGDDRWGYESVLERYRRIEDWRGPDDPTRRGVAGPMVIEPVQVVHPFSSALLEAAESIGLPRFDSPNGEMAEVGAGCAVIDKAVNRGVRWSPYRAFVRSQHARANLTVLTGALVTKVVVAGGRATGVEVRHAGQNWRVHATTEVILSLGALQTPKVLMQSGIGPADALAALDIPVVQDLPGVGQNLDDHLLLSYVWESGDRPMPGPTNNESVFAWAEDDADVPDHLLYTAPSAFMSREANARFDPPESAFTFMHVMRLRSRGSLQLSGAGPDDSLRIDTGLFSEPEDVARAADGIRMARAIADTDALRPFRRKEVAPQDLGRNALEDYLRDAAMTFWHPSGTARMGRDELSVVDSTLRVQGVEGLRVADSSVLPHVTLGNTMAPCVVVGERAAELIGERL